MNNIYSESIRINKYVQGKQNYTLYFVDSLNMWFDEKTILKGTARAIYEHVKNIIEPCINPYVLLVAVNAEHLMELMEIASSKAKSYKEKLWELFSMFFQDMIVEQYILNNPMVDVKPCKRDKIELILFSDEEMRRFIKVAECSMWFLEIMLALCCGLKRGEIYGLKFADFNLVTKSVHIQRIVTNQLILKENNQMSSYMVEKELPSKRCERIVAVPDLIIEELKYRKRIIKSYKHNEDFEEKDLICCQKNGNYKTTGAINTAIKKICKKSGVREISLQSLRDMYAFKIIQYHKNAFVLLQGLLGYESIEAVYERYSEVCTDKLGINEIMNRLYADEVKL